MPVVNLYLPHSVLAEIADHSLWRDRIRYLAPVWWLTWLTGVVFAVVIEVGDTRAGPLTHFWAFVLNTVAGGLLIVLMLRISRAQEARIARGAGPPEPIAGLIMTSPVRPVPARHIGRRAGRPTRARRAGRAGWCDDRVMTELVGLADVEAARDLLAGVVRTTPLEPCRPLTAALAGPAWLKCENLQRAGSYKVRGAYVRIARLTDAERARGVVAASAGNHAQGVALAASLLGTDATVFMPVGAPLPKVAATKGYGARDRVRRQHRRRVAGRGPGVRRADRRGVDPPVRPPGRDRRPGHGGAGDPRAVPGGPHDHHRRRRRRPDLRHRGGGQGAAAAHPGDRRAGDGRRRVPALAARRARPYGCRAFATIADGIAVGCPGDLTFAHVSKLVDEIVTVTEEDISRALLMLLERGKLVVEPAGAVGVAALLAGVVEAEPPAVAVLSGGNIDPVLLLRVIEHGLAAAGRYLRFTVRCADRPGQLAVTARPDRRRTAPTWWTWCTSGRTRACGSARSRWRWPWRPGAPSTRTSW